ncbi:MAG: hypothetical protein IPM42_13970 [Saprospiraceae bacterium]|nr:hypothetical protein [Saprospiraceae bacterium]
MIDQHLAKASKELYERYKSIENPTYLDLYLVLQNLITIYELSEKSLFNEGFYHIYLAAKKFIDYKPDQPEGHFSGLQRELNYTVTNLPYLLDTNRNHKDD